MEQGNLLELLCGSCQSRQEKTLILAREEKFRSENRATQYVTGAAVPYWEAAKTVGCACRIYGKTAIHG